MSKVNTLSYLSDIPEQMYNRFVVIYNTVSYIDNNKSNAIYLSDIDDNWDSDKVQNIQLCVRLAVELVGDRIFDDIYSAIYNYKHNCHIDPLKWSTDVREKGLYAYR